MTDRPIIFSAPMVRALLDGRKTQTRRVLKKTQGGAIDRGFNVDSLRLPCALGDRLYVRESMRWANGLRYSADNSLVPLQAVPQDFIATRPHITAIHMPRWASRLTLTVTDVRVQRLQDISEVDAVAEGVEPCKREWSGVEEFGLSSDPLKRRRGFRTLWNSLHGPDAWDANPWVVALTFTVRHGNIDRIGGAK